LKRAIQHQLLDPLSIAVLDGQFQEGDLIEVSLADKALSFQKSK
jgi:ATP-dependent Clp protease ATP-binding subunit ClpB